MHCLATMTRLQDAAAARELTRKAEILKGKDDKAITADIELGLRFLAEALAALPGKDQASKFRLVRSFLIEALVASAARSYSEAFVTGWAEELYTALEATGAL